MSTKNEIMSFTKQVPLKRLGNTEDIASAVIFLSSDLNCFITGHNLIIDGGFLGSVSA